MKPARQKPGITGNPRPLFLLRIDIPALLATILFVGLIFFYMIPGFERVMMERKRNLIHEMTSSAFSILSYYQNLEKTKILSSDSARNQARNAVRTIRYGNLQKDYFWITDLHPVMIMHPYRPELEGKDLKGFKDSGGKRVFVDFVNAVSNGGDSYVDYMWQWNDDSTRIVPKLSYVRLFEPWGWIIGTGIYIDDVKTEIRKIERRALMISGGIGSLIVLMLLFISRYSHSIELRRARAEEELRKSKELYRTLAEQATEGVLIWSASGLQANKTLLSYLLYSEDELRSLSLRDIFISPALPGMESPDHFYSELNTRRHAAVVLKRKDGSILNAHADYSRILIGGSHAVLGVIRTSSSQSTASSISIPGNLLEGITTGFFKTTYGRSNYFLDASPVTIRMLGYREINELLPKTIESFFADRDQLKAFRKSLSEREGISSLVLLRDRKNASFYARVNVVVVESDDSGNHCEGNIEFIAYREKDLSLSTNESIPFTECVMKNTVLAFSSPFSGYDENTPLNILLKEMEKNHSCYTVLINSENEPSGSIDLNKLAKLIGNGENTGSPVFKWMTVPPQMIREELKIFEAIQLFNETGSQGMVITDSSGKALATLSRRDIIEAFSESPGIVERKIQNSNSIPELRQAFLTCHKMFVKLIRGNEDPYNISIWFSDMSDKIFNRTVELCLCTMDAPPCPFAFIQTGSAGRKEQSLFTDQDNAIIFADEGSSTGTEYFVALGKKVNHALNEIGYHLCKGGKMAGNPEWCQPLSVWKNYFSGWISAPGPEEMVGISVFFDFRHCYGDAGITKSLRLHISEEEIPDAFFYHHTMAWMPFDPDHSALEGEKMDIKKILMPFTGLIRMYSLKNKIEAFSSIERIIQLQSQEVLDRKEMFDYIQSWKDLTRLRLLAQAGRPLEDNGSGNEVFLNSGIFETHQIISKAIKQVNNLMLKAKTGFGIQQI